MSDVIKWNIGDGIELLIDGLPQAIIAPAVPAQAALAMVKHVIPMGAHFSQGVIGGVSNAALRIGGQVYRLKFQVIAMRAITALEIYKDLAEMTADFIRESAQKEVQSLRDPSASIETHCIEEKPIINDVDTSPPEEKKE